MSVGVCEVVKDRLWKYPQGPESWRQWRASLEPALYVDCKEDLVRDWLDAKIFLDNSGPQGSQKVVFLVLGVLEGFLTAQSKV